VAERTVVIASTVGLHARPAALFCKAAAATGMPVTIRKPGGEAVPAASILSVLTLGANHGDEVVLAADGDGADDALDELVALLARDLDA
jgi:phosphocarrier protein HPr